MSVLRPGQRVRITEDADHDGELAVIWDAAPGPGCYWAHLLPGHELVRIKVRHLHHEARPVVTIQKEWE